MRYGRRNPCLWMTLVVTMALLLLAVGTAAVRAQTGEPYDLTWWTVDGGGEQLTGGSYVLQGMAGQPDAGSALSGGSYRLAGGFWVSGGAAAGTRYKVYLPLALKNH